MQTFKLSKVSCGFAFIFLLGVACQSDLSRKENAKEEAGIDSVSAQEELYKEVMVIHDEIMPAMSDIMSLNKKIKSVQKTNPEEADKITELTGILESASEGMMNWMRNFNPKIENMTPEEAARYLEDEKKKITAVKQDMEAAIEKANKFVQDHNELATAPEM